MKTWFQTFRIDWDHLDGNLHVANTHYNCIATNARVAFMFECGYTFNQTSVFAPVVLTDSISYRKELRLGDTGTVEILLSGLSTDDSKWKMRHLIKKSNGDTSCVIDSFCGWINLSKRKLSPPTGIFLEPFKRLQRTSDFEILKPLSGESFHNYD
jgi:acyl-CoA thioester hydrolase